MREFIVSSRRLKRTAILSAAVIWILTVCITRCVKRTVTVHKKNWNSISLLNPYDVEDDENINCIPLTAAFRVEKICTYPDVGDENLSKFMNETRVLLAPIVNNVKTILIDDNEKGLIDIGTNIGMYTITAASMGHPVVGVEPSQSKLQRLAKSLRKSPHLIPLTKIITNRISDNSESIPFRYRHPLPPTKVIIPESGSKLKYPPTDFNAVAKKTGIGLDDLLKVISFKRAILNINIGGYEIQALIQADRLFSAIDISHVFIRWGRKGDDWNEAMFFLAFFMSRGYTAHSADEFAPLEMTLEDCKIWPHNVVWIKTERWAKEIPKMRRKNKHANRIEDLKT